MGESRSRIEGATVLVEADEQGVWIMPVDVVGAVSVVAVRIHNGHPFYAVFLAQVFHHDGLHVDMAESPSAVGNTHGMVARGSYQGKTAVDLFVHDGPGNGLGATGADQMGLGGYGCFVGNAEVYPLDFLCGDQVWLVFLNAADVEDSFFHDLIQGVEKSLLPFWMGGVDGPVKCRKKYKACSFVGFQHFSPMVSLKDSLNVSFRDV